MRDAEFINTPQGSSENWRDYFREEINDGLVRGKDADRFNQYLIQFQEAEVSVYISDLTESVENDGSRKPKWSYGPKKFSPEDSLMDGGIRSHEELDKYLDQETEPGLKLRLITVDAISTEVIQILGTKYNMAPEFFKNRAYMGRKSHEARLYQTKRGDPNGTENNHCFMVIEIIDYVWLGGEQPEHLQLRSKADCVFEFETPYEEGNYPLYHPAFLWGSNNMVMSTMPRKVSFYLISGTPGSPSTCIIFLETIARSKPRPEAPCTLHLSSRTGSTVIWEQGPKIVRGMYFPYFLFDCFGCYQPSPWDSQAYNSCVEKMENNSRLAQDGRWALCSFFKALGAITQFTLVGWNERLGVLSREAMAQSSLWLARELHMHLDDLYFHHEKANLHIRLGKVILDEYIGLDMFQGNHDIMRFLKDYVRNSEYRLQRYDRLEKKIQNTIEMIFNTVTIQEAHTSAVQNERLGYLTLLATFFIPLTYLASLFSMSVREFDKDSVGTLPTLTNYFTIAIPLTLAVFMFAWVLRVLMRATLWTGIVSFFQVAEDAIVSALSTTARGSFGRRSKAQETKVREELMLNSAVVRDTVEASGSEGVREGKGDNKDHQQHQLRNRFERRVTGLSLVTNRLGRRASTTLTETTTKVMHEVVKDVDDGGGGASVTEVRFGETITPALERGQVGGGMGMGR